MFAVQTIETFIDAPLNRISGIGDMVLVDLGGTLFLLTATRSGGGVLSFNLSSGMTLVGQAGLTSIGALSAPPSLDVFWVGGTPRLIASGLSESSLYGLNISATGSFGSVSRPAGGPVGVITSQAFVTLGERNIVYLAMAGEGSLRSYEFSATGTMTQIGSLTVAGAQHGINIPALVPVTVGASHFIVAAVPGEHRIDIFRIEPDASLVKVGTFGADQGLGLALPGEMKTLTAHGETWLLVTAAGTSSISLFRVSEEGGLTLADHVMDTLDSRFQGLRAIDAITVNGRSFVVAGGGDQGLTLFEILPGGRLVFLRNVLQQNGEALDNINVILAHEVAGGIGVFVASEGTGITRLLIETGNLGAPITGGAGADDLTGSAAHDLISGGAGNDTLYGGSGNDILIDGPGQDELFGGAGADLFVLVADNEPDTIRDFQPGLDRIDISAWYGYRDFSGVSFTQTSWGATITFLGETLHIYSANGLPLSREDIRLAVSGGLWHMLPDVTQTQEGVHGTEMNDVMEGGAGDDRLLGLQGDDLLIGRAGADSLYGGAGNDSLIGGPGADLLDGGEGRDRVLYSDATIGVRVDFLNPAVNSGDAAGDTYISIEDLQGSPHNDSLLADHAPNRILGAGGDDIIYGRGGNDTLFGGEGNDTLVGGHGADILDGGPGRDRALYSDAPTAVRVDFLTPSVNTGYAAGDTYISIEDLQGSSHNDSLLGDHSPNRILGAGGDDIIYGRGGNDTLFGGQGNDTLVGGDGADVLDGGSGIDRALYSDSPVGLRVDLHNPASNTGYAAGDTYISIEELQGSSHNDRLLGDNANNRILGAAGNDTLFGRGGNDTIYGGAGNDVIYGNTGNDLLFGGAGSDVFVFDSAPGLANADHIGDFSSVTDQIHLSGAVYQAIASGTLAGSAFVTGAAATTSAHRIIYNPATGQIFYDADGNGAGAALLVATLQPGTALYASDFVVI